MTIRVNIEPRVVRKSADSVRQQGLFPCEAEIAKRLSQDARDWAHKAVVLERDGLPKIDPLMGGRFWPAVHAYWHRRYGLLNIGAQPLDGKENFDAL